MKTCCRCKKRKDFTCFYRRANSIDGYFRQCKDCANLATSNSRHTHKEKAKNRRKKVADRFRLEQQEYKKRFGCVCCGEKEVACLDLHHIDRSIKDIHPSSATSRKLFYEEAKKCVVVCANCHRKIHAGIIICPHGVSGSTPVL